MNSLINTPYLPGNYRMLCNEARRSLAYYMQAPYPNFGFRTWKTETQGPLPLCMPIAKHITNQSARWLFGKPLGFEVNGAESEWDQEAAERIDEIWGKNRMATRILAAAKMGGLSGGYVLKFHVDPEKKASGQEIVDIQVFDVNQQAKVYVDPMDISKMLMVRLEYPFYDAVKGTWYMWREEWTDTEYVEYVPQELRVGGPESRLDTIWDNYNAMEVNGTDKWVIAKKSKNIYGMIPCVLVKNIDIGADYGWGDLWSLYGAIDRINLSFDLMHKGNQLTAYPKEIRLNATTSPDDDGAPLMPGEPEYLVPIEKDVDVQVFNLQSDSAGRTHLASYTESMIRWLYESAGSVNLDPSMITGHGALSAQVLKLIYNPLIETTREKQQCQGENGIAVFFESLAKAMSNMGLDDPLANSEDINVVVQFADFFEKSEEEKLAQATRLNMLVEGGLMRPETAATELAVSHGMVDAQDAADEVDNSLNDADTPTATKKGEDKSNDSNEKPGNPERKKAASDQSS